VAILKHEEISTEKIPRNKEEFHLANTLALTPARRADVERVFTRVSASDVSGNDGCSSARLQDCSTMQIMRKLHE